MVERAEQWKLHSHFKAPSWPFWTECFPSVWYNFKNKVQHWSSFLEVPTQISVNLKFSLTALNGSALGLSQISSSQTDCGECGEYKHLRFLQRKLQPIPVVTDSLSAF